MKQITEAEIEQTKKSFADKWFNHDSLAFKETNRQGSEIQNWILNRNGFSDLKELQNFLADKRRILDAGCGNGRVTALLRNNSNPATTEVVGADLVASPVAFNNLIGKENIKFFQADLLSDCTSLGKFDFIYCQEVLHHIADPEKAFNNLSKCLNPGGLIAIYVYKKKAPVREFADDHIRNLIKDMPYNDAMKVCAALTELGKNLSDLNQKVNVPDIPVLEITRGEYDIQRLFYHFFLKCFWNNDLSFEENVSINYDWYHPQICYRYELSEIRQWFKSADLKIVHEHTDYYGITIHGRA